MVPKVPRRLPLGGERREPLGRPAHEEQKCRALKSLGRETQLIVYPGASHSLEKPSHRRDRMKRYLAWYGKYLEGGEERTTR